MGRHLVAGIAVLVLAGCGSPGIPDHLVPGTRECVGLPESKCEEILANLSDDPAAELSAIRIRCSSATCTDQSGSVDVAIVWADGRTDSRSTSWDGAPLDARIFAPIPTPPVPPSCEGVPLSECQGEWTTATENLSAERFADVVLVLVQCSGICSETSGAGQTFIGFRDGTRIRPSTWSYNHNP